MKSKNKQLIKKCENLWRNIVKEKAKNKSELSGNDSNILHCHHCKGKLSSALRFDTRGGICITSGEHFKAHATDNYDIQTQIREVIKKREGDNIFDILSMQKNKSKIDLEIVALQLESELKAIR